MKTPFPWLLAILALVAAVVVFGFARPSYAQPKQNPTPSAAPAPAPPQNPAPAPAVVKHTITVRFDYDFDRTPACPQAANKRCVQQFVVYDISNGPLPKRRFQLFTIPVPPNAKGAMREIKGQSPALPFQSGEHMIGVSAQMSDNKTESFPSKCAVWVRIP